MKKRVLSILIAFTLLMALISFAAPVMAQGTGNSADVYLSVAESDINPAGTLHYTVTIFNNAAIPGANPATVDVYFRPPGPTGADSAFGPEVTIALDVPLALGETKAYNFDGSGGATAVPALAVDLGAIPLNPGVTVVYAFTRIHADYITTGSPYYSDSSKNIPVDVIQGSTIVAISPLNFDYTIDYNTGTTLTVTETNNGNTPLYDVYVQLSGGSSLKLERTSGYFVASTDPLVPGTLDVLDEGEVWRWEGVPTGVLTASTSFTATGYAKDKYGTEITPPTYDDEEASITINVETPPPPTTVPASTYLGLGLMIVCFGGIIAFLVYRNRRQMQL